MNRRSTIPNNMSESSPCASCFEASFDKFVYPCEQLLTLDISVHVTQLTKETITFRYSNDKVIQYIKI